MTYYIIQSTAKTDTQWEYVGVVDWVGKSWLAKRFESVADADYFAKIIRRLKRYRIVELRR